MELFFMFFGGIITLTGLSLLSKKPKYQFEKTTNGHMVKFLDFDQARRNRHNKIYGKLAVLAGMSIFCVSILMLLVKK